MSGSSYPFRPINPVARRRRNLKTKDLSLIAVYAALYAVLVIVFQPISFSALQFRVAGTLRPAIAKKKTLAVGYALGTIVANIFSPFTGPYELLFMPVMSLIAGVAGHAISKRFNYNYYLCGITIATIIPLSVSWMLYQLFNLPIVSTLPGLLISEQIINILGATMFKMIEPRYRWWE
ncbi:hypothetical protein GF326_00095 [Candidatus Bathyarchaeota archaeon]|nr:hypothetical protein [Candidatus Bathyarchaeota archaeon]